jgi:hypothetical protein
MTWKMARTTEKLKNENCTPQYLEYGEKTYKRGKGVTHIVGNEIWRETLKNV